MDQQLAEQVEYKELVQALESLTPELRSALAESLRKGTFAENVEHYRHWWREPAAGLFSVLIACFDTWYMGSQKGFSNSLDEILLLVGITLLAGAKNLFGGRIEQMELPKNPGTVPSQ